MIVGFQTFEQWHGKKNIGGTRLRAHWPILRWHDAGPEIGDAELYTFGRKYDAIVFQKVYNWDLAENFDGVKILDLCDPDWLHWGYPVKRMIEACDVIVTSSEKLAAAVAVFAGETPVYCINDHVLDPEKLPVKEHKGDLRYVSWYGYGENFPALEPAIPALVKRGLELIVVATAPFTPSVGTKLEVRNLPWTPETWQADFMRGDVVLNPKLNHGRFAYKSDNKTVHPWACGMPVAHNDTELDQFISAESRTKEGLARRQWVIENRDVRKHVEALKKIILDIQKKKNGRLAE